MKIHLTQVSRAEKASITGGILALLTARQQSGPPEPTLDAYIPELDDLGARLDAHVLGNVVADGARALLLAKLDVADDAVDAHYRHIEGFLDIEAHRRRSPHAVHALACHQAAFPDGLGHVDDRIIDENRYCRGSLAVLQAPENAALLINIAFPTGWLPAFANALDASDAALDEVVNARIDKSTHISQGRNAEDDWVDTMVRLRRYISSRAKRTDKAKIAEGRALLRPLLDELKRLSTEAAARATRKAEKGDKGDQVDAPPVNKPNGAGTPPIAPPGTP
jgi:hypothetical protein